MRAIVAQHLVVAVTALLLGCSDSPTEISGSTTPTPPAPQQPVQRLTVTPNTATINAGRAIQLAATDGLGVALLPSEVSWTSLQPGIATVGADGVVRGRSPGEAEIVARRNTARALARIVVLKAIPEQGPLP